MDPRIEAHQRAGEILKQIQDLEAEYADHMNVIGQMPAGNYRRPTEIQTTPHRKRGRPRKEEPADFTRAGTEKPGELETLTHTKHDPMVDGWEDPFNAKQPTADEFTVKVPLITDAQFGKIYATLADEGIKREDQQDAIIKALLKQQQGIEVDSKTQIRRDHAIDLITDLSHMDREDMMDLLPEDLKEPF